MTLKEKMDAAQKMVNDLCCKKREWVLSVPGRHDHDPDLVISGALRAAQEEVERLRALLTEARGYLHKRIVWHDHERVLVQRIDEAMAAQEEGA